MYESLLGLQSAQTVDQRAIDHKMKLTTVKGTFHSREFHFVSYCVKISYNTIAHFNFQNQYKLFLTAVVIAMKLCEEIGCIV